MSENDKGNNFLTSSFLSLNDTIAAESSNISQLDNTLYLNPNMTVGGQCLYTTTLPAELAGSFPEGTVLQILPDSTILAVPPAQAPSNVSTNNASLISNVPSLPTELINDQNSTVLPNLLMSSHQNVCQEAEIPMCTEGNISDLDLSFLTESEESITNSRSLSEATVKELQSMIDNVNPNTLGSLVLENNPSNDMNSSLELTQQKPKSPKVSEETPQDVVMIDVSKPIQLSQNSLIMVNGRKCVLQQHAETGQVIAYPVREPSKPRRKRGRPKKISFEETDNDTTFEKETLSTTNNSEEEKEKGLLEILNDDGSLVRRSSRKRKKAQVLKDYETGNLKQELGSDAEDSSLLDDFEACFRKKRHKGPGRPKKAVTALPNSVSISDCINESLNKRPRGRPKKQITEKEPTQAFLVQTADGQSLMMQVPLSSIPSGVTLQEVALSIAQKLNSGLSISNTNLIESKTEQENSESSKSTQITLRENSESVVELVVQDHSIGSTTNFPNADNLINEGSNGGIVESSCSNIISDLEEVIVDSACDSQEINEVTLTENKPESFLTGNELEKQYSTTEENHLENNLPSSIPTSSNLSIDNSSIFSSLSTQVCSDRTENRDIINSFNTENFMKDFLSDNDFLKDKVNIHMLLQNVEKSVEETVSEIERQNSQHNSSLISANSSLDSSLKLPSIIASSDRNQISGIKSEISVSECDKAIESYDFLNCNVTDSSDMKDNRDNDVILRNNAIISSIEHDHDFLIPIKSTPVSKCETSSITSNLISIHKDIETKDQTLQLILPVENLPLHTVPVTSKNSKSATVISVVENQQNPEAVQPIVLPSIIEETEKKCKICHRFFDGENELINHFKSDHPKCICLECNYMAEHGYVIKRHSLRHLSAGCVCKLCGKQYKDRYILKMHVKMVHLPAEAVFTCEICTKKFTRKAHLKRHLRIHEPNKPYKCPICEYRGCERSDITKHLLVHDTPKHKCHICGKCFRHTKNKELHLKRHYKQRDYKCGICDFYGYTFTDIRKHIERRHASSKTNNCADCGLLFINKEALEAHKNNGQCQMYVLEQDLTSQEMNSSGDKKELSLLEDISLDILDEAEQAQVISIVSNDCSGIKLEADSIALNSAEGILNSAENGQLVVNGFEASDLLSSETLSLIPVDRESSKLITLVATNGKKISLPLKNDSTESLENVLSVVSSSGGETSYFLSEFEIGAGS